MIQLYVNINDLIQTEEFDHADPSAVEKVRQSIQDIGLRDKFNVKPDGYILKGNTRLQFCQDLNYVPISLPSFLGLFINSDGTQIRIRQSILDEFANTHENSCQSCWSFPARTPKTKEERTTDIIRGVIKTGDTYGYYKLIKIHRQEVSPAFPFSPEFRKIAQSTEVGKYTQKDKTPPEEGKI